MTRRSGAGIWGRITQLVRIGSAVAGSAGVAAGLWRAAGARPPGGAQRWQRTNHRGEAVTLLEGPVMAAALAIGCATAPGVAPRVRLAATLAAASAGGIGVLDDLAEQGSSKGLRGHLAALSRGEVTTGTVKIAGLALTGLGVAVLIGTESIGTESTGTETTGTGRLRRSDRARLAQIGIDSALVAGAANLANLLDLRPGRCLKVGLLATPAALGTNSGGPLVAVTTGAALALLPIDLAEQAMLGDGGANALGAVLGAAAVAGAPPRRRAVALAAIVALTLISERVSFTRVIESTPGLRELDALGRRPR